MSNTVPNSKKDNVTKGLVIALGIAFVLAGVGYYAAKSGMSKADAESQLASFNESLAQYGKSHGYNIKLTYNDMEIHGSIFSKRAELKNAEISLEPTKDDTFYGAMKIKSAKVEIDAKDNAFSSFTVAFPEPVTILSEEGNTQATFSEPLTIDVEREPAETGTNANYSANLPPSMTLARPDESTAEMAFGSGSTMSGMVNFSASNYSHETQVNNLKVLENGETISAASVNATVESGVQDKEFMKHQSFDIKELAFDGPRAALGKLNVVADVESDAPESTGADGAAATESKGTAINTLKVEAADQSFAVNAKGEVQATTNEILPQGELAVTIEKPKVLIGKLNQAGIINPLMERIAYTILPKIDTAWKDESDTVNFTLKRHAEQPLYVGSLTFEELTAQVFTGLMQQATPSAGLESLQSEQSPEATGQESQSEPKPVDPSELGIDEQDINHRMEKKMQELEQQLKNNEQHAPVTPKPEIKQQ